MKARLEAGAGGGRHRERSFALKYVLGLVGVAAPWALPTPAGGTQLPRSPFCAPMTLGSYAVCPRRRGSQPTRFLGGPP